MIELASGLAQFSTSSHEAFHYKQFSSPSTFLCPIHYSMADVYNVEQ